MTSLREMRPAEASAVSSFLLRCNEENVRAFPPAVARSYVREVTDVAGRLATSDVLLAEDAGVLIGSVTFVRDAADDGHPWPAGGAVLRLLAVAPEARGSGLGSTLTLACLDRARARRAGFVGLHTAPFMTAARRLYERLGFVRAPEHDFHPELYYAGDDTEERIGEQAPWGLAYTCQLSP